MPVPVVDKETGAAVPGLASRDYTFSAPYTFAEARQDFITLPRPEGFGARSLFYVFTEIRGEDAALLTRNYLGRSPDVVGLTIDSAATALYAAPQPRIDHGRAGQAPRTDAFRLNAFETRGKMYLRDVLKA